MNYTEEQSSLPAMMSAPWEDGAEPALSYPDKE